MLLFEEDIINIFEIIDTDNNGSISYEEFVIGFEKIFPDMFDGSLGALFRFADKNDDKQLSIDEFIDLVRFLEKETHTNDPFVMLFDKCDVDQDHTLNLSEFILIFRSINPDMDLQLIKKLFTLADTDRNGVIDFAEYMELVASIQHEEVEENEENEESEE